MIIMISGGPAPFHPHGDTKEHDQSAWATPEFASRFRVLDFPNPSYPAVCRQATSYAWRNRLRRIPLGWSEDARGEVREGGARHSVAALGGQNPSRGGVARNSWPSLAAHVARGPPHRQDGKERRGAPDVTHSVFWRTGAQKVMENVTYFEHQQKNEILVPDRGAKYITHSYVS